MSGAGPQVAALVFIEIANGNAGQALFEAVLNPVPVIEPVYSAIRRHPDAAITMTAQERIDTIKSAAHFRPVVAVELPDSVGGGAPDFAISQFDETDGRFGIAFVRSDKSFPFLFMKKGGAMLGAEPEVAILRFEKSRDVIANGGIGGRAGEGLESGSVEGL